MKNKNNYYNFINNRENNNKYYSVNIPNSKTNKNYKNESRNLNINKNIKDKRNKKDEEEEKKKQLEIQKMKKEIEIENNIRDVLKCYICLTKVRKPRMCQNCKKICCEACITKWLENHSSCGICKHHVTLNDMIALPFLDDMSSFFINNIDNHPKNKEIFNNDISSNKLNQKTFQENRKETNNEGKKINNYVNNIDNEIIMNNINETNEESEIEESERDKNMCANHNSKIEFYCIQCNKYFCSKCLVFFGEESKKHSQHYIIKVDKIDDLGVTEAIKEYNKLPETKNKIENLIGLCNLKIKENEIKKYETIKTINIIKDLYIKDIDEESLAIKDILKQLIVSKNEILNQYSSFLNKYLDIMKNNNIIEAQRMNLEFKQLNDINQKIEKDIKEKSKIIPKIYIENYQTDFIDFNILVSGQQFSENQELLNEDVNLNINYPCKLKIRYLRNKIIISCHLTVNEPINSPEFPILYIYIIFRSQKYGLEFINLSNKNKSQIISQNIEQINSIEFDKFLFLCNGENKISLKFFVTKSYNK